ncbi:hypothetical protein DSO57_1016028 [Entomophthora muscae]|uniref:Uncharacterized protein n=1 Tax=Entomophthora muscae TaxID=34485 RepID=A0ACC2UFC0_9FUNG|nr:hypothetical protein DSO57_1016028 [Entomophthora muscae]
MVQQSVHQHHSAHPNKFLRHEKFPGATLIVGETWTPTSQSLPTQSSQPSVVRSQELAAAALGLPAAALLAANLTFAAISGDNPKFN